MCQAQGTQNKIKMYMNVFFLKRENMKTTVSAGRFSMNCRGDDRNLHMR
jgi:hypothetical protein